MPVVDMLIVVALVLSTLIGGFRGVVREAMSLLAWVIGVWLAYRNYADVGAQIGKWRLHEMLDSPVVQNILGFLAVLIAVLIAAAVLGYVIRAALSAIGMGPVDRFLGLLFGLARGALIVMVAVALVESTSLSKSPAWESSQLAPPFRIAALALVEHLPEDFSSY